MPVDTSAVSYHEDRPPSIQPKRNRQSLPRLTNCDIIYDDEIINYSALSNSTSCDNYIPESPFSATTTKKNNRLTVIAQDEEKFLTVTSAILSHKQDVQFKSVKFSPSKSVKESGFRERSSSLPESYHRSVLSRLKGDSSHSTLPLYRHDVGSLDNSNLTIRSENLHRKSKNVQIKDSKYEDDEFNPLAMLEEINKLKKKYGKISVEDNCSGSEAIIDAIYSLHIEVIQQFCLLKLDIREEKQRNNVSLAKLQNDIKQLKESLQQ